MYASHNTVLWGRSRVLALFLVTIILAMAFDVVPPTACLTPTAGLGLDLTTVRQALPDREMHRAPFASGLLGGVCSLSVIKDVLEIINMSWLRDLDGEVRCGATLCHLGMQGASGLRWW